MTVVEKFRVAVAGGELALVLHAPDPSSPVPYVVACHGLSASKDSDKYLLLADALPAAGLALARFDFRGCGESSGVEEDTTIASRIEDVEAVLAALGDHPRLTPRLGLLGSSLGGFVALQVAARRPGLPVVTWNAPASLTELANDDLEEGRALGLPFALEYATGRYALAPRGIAPPSHRSRRRRRGGEPRPRGGAARGGRRAVRAPRGRGWGPPAHRSRAPGPGHRRQPSVVPALARMK